MKKLCSLFLAFCLLTGLAACKGNASNEPGSAKNDYPVTIGDVTIDKAPSKVIVLDPSLADIITTLGSGFEIKLTARGEECTQEALSPIPAVGTPEEPDIQQILTRAPELVLTSEELSESQKEQLDSAGIQALVLEPATDRETFEALYSNIGSAMLGAKSGYETARKRAREIFLSIDDVGRLIPEDEKTVTACYVKDAKTGELLAADTLGGRLLEYAGAINIVSESANAVMSAGELETADPQFIFCAEGEKEAVASHALFSDLNAVKNGNIIEIPSSYMEWQGKTVLTAVIALAGAMHPDYAATASEGAGGEVASSSSSSSSSSASGSSSNTLEGAPSSVDEKSPSGDISKLQARLIELGYLYGSPFGVYNSYTKDAVSEFQKKCGMTATGICDEETARRLFADDAPRF